MTNTLRRVRRRRAERGSAMLVTLIIITALLAGGAVLVSLQMASSRSADLARTGASSLFCAEAGLSAVRKVIGESPHANWPNWLCQQTDISKCNMTDDGFTTALNGLIANRSIDGDGTADFEVFIRDNDDEPGLTDITVDNDLRIFIGARCLKYPDNVKVVEELVEYNQGTSCIGNMLGGPDSDGNTNGGC